MAVSFQYVARETGNNLWRNKLMTVGAVLCVWVSLAIVGGALVLRQGVSNATIQWRSGVDMSVYMRTDATPQQTQAIDAQLRQRTDIKRFSFCDQRCAYAEFNKMFANTQEFLDTMHQVDLPPSFRVVPVHPELISNVGDQLKDQPGVKTVEYAKDAIQGLLKVTRYAQYFFLGLAGILLGLAVLLIVNTIRMAIFSRRREVAVMKLVGATNWFIRIPFMLEGLVQGLLGGALAFAVMYAGRDLLFHVLATNELFKGLVASTGQVVYSGVIILAVGGLVGALGSAAAVSRFLDV